MTRPAISVLVDTKLVAVVYGKDDLKAWMAANNVSRCYALVSGRGGFNIELKHDRLLGFPSKQG